MHLLPMVCECQVQHFLSLHESEEVLYLDLDLVNNASIYKKVTGFSIFLLLMISANEVHKTSVTWVTWEESRWSGWIQVAQEPFDKMNRQSRKKGFSLILWQFCWKNKIVHGKEVFRKEVKRWDIEISLFLFFLLYWNQIFLSHNISQLQFPFPWLFLIPIHLPSIRVTSVSVSLGNKLALGDKIKIK